MEQYFFTCTIRDVHINGTEVKNALIVNGVQTGPSQPDLTYALPEAYRGANIMGCRYIPETQTFEQVDPEPEVHEPTQLDRIENASMQAALESEYVASLIELGL